MMLCAWCSGDATMFTGSEWAPPCCESDACRVASKEVVGEIERRRDRLAAQVASRGPATAAPHLTEAERAEGWTALYLATVVAQGGSTVVRVLARRADEETYGRAWMVRVEAPDVRPLLPLGHRSEWEAVLYSVLNECARWQWSLRSLARSGGR